MLAIDLPLQKTNKNFEGKKTITSLPFFYLWWDKKRQLSFLFFIPCWRVPYLTVSPTFGKDSSVFKHRNTLDLMQQHSHICKFNARAQILFFKVIVFKSQIRILCNRLIMSNATKVQTDMPWSALISSFMIMKVILEKCFLVDYAKNRKFREIFDPEGNVTKLEWAVNIFCINGGSSHTIIIQQNVFWL